MLFPPMDETRAGDGVCVYFFSDIYHVYRILYEAYNMRFGCTVVWL